jgi:hypothetical protein
MPKRRTKMSKEEATEHRREYQRKYYLRNREKAKEYQRWYCKTQRPKTNRTVEINTAQAKAKALKPDGPPIILHDLPAEKFAKVVNAYLRDKFIPSLRA